MVDRAPKGRKQRVSLLAAVTSEGLDAERCLIHSQSVTKPAFKTYLDEVLLPTLKPGSILVMDNWTVHRGQDIIDLVHAYDCSILYLPTYSPDFNPIEYLFSKIKAIVKKLRGQTDEELIEAFAQGVLSITPEDVANTFEHCGYE